MKINKQQKEYGRNLPYEKQEELLIKLHKSGYSTRNCATIFGFTTYNVVKILEKFDIKMCAMCKRIKSLSEFHKADNNLSGYEARCKVCKGEYYKKNKNRIQQNYEDNKDIIKEYMKERYNNNREHVQKINRRSHLKNKEKRKQRKCEYYQENKDYILQHNKDYRQRTKEDRKRYQDEYYKNNKSRYVAASAKRNAQKLKATPTHANFDKINQIYDECYEKSTTTTGIRHEVDHIVPLQGKNVCGFHVEYNLRVIPVSENRKKYNKFLIG